MPAEVTLTALDIPPAPRQLGACVKHLECAQEGPAADILAKQLALPQVLALTSSVGRTLFRRTYSLTGLQRK